MIESNIITKTIMDTMVEWWDEMHGDILPLDWKQPFNANEHMDNVHMDNGTYDVPQCMYIHQFMHHLNNDDVIVDCAIGAIDGFAPINPQMAHNVWGQLVNSFIGMDYAIVYGKHDATIDEHVESMIMGLFAIALQHGGIFIKQ
jgi:hypothetical protein